MLSINCLFLHIVMQLGCAADMLGLAEIKISPTLLFELKTFSLWNQFEVFWRSFKLDKVSVTFLAP